MTAHWLWPQWTLIGLYVLGMLRALVKDGDPETGKISLARTTLAVVIGAWVLWCGGFWS